jgi:hypothetical protein
MLGYEEEQNHAETAIGKLADESVQKTASLNRYFDAVERLILTAANFPQQIACKGGSRD